MCVYVYVNEYVLCDKQAIEEQGSCSEDLLKLLIETLELESDMLSTAASRWNHVCSPFELPPGFHLFVADVDQGSNTPALVSNVLKWKSLNGPHGKFYFL